MKELPSTLYTAEQTRLLDKTAIDEGGIPGFTLMKRAGRAVFFEIQKCWPDIKSLTVLCGGGNNGGDGFVVAALARQKGFSVQAFYVGGDDFACELRGEAREAWLWASSEGVKFDVFKDDQPFEGDVIVDALLGTGLVGHVRGVFHLAINKINRHVSPVIAVDIPSGLCADTGQVLGCAVKADVTVTFIGLKLGLFMHQAVEHVGVLSFDGLHIPESVYEQVSVSAFRVGADDIAECLPARSRLAHKGMCGHVLVIGGDQGMGGAAIMAAEAALYSGAGKVTLATRGEHLTAALCRCPEIMVRAVESGVELLPLLEQADVIVFGPGIGQQAWAEQMLQVVWKTNLPAVIDADGLNILLKKDRFNQLSRKNWILTPHPGEAARLLESEVSLLQKDRISSAMELQTAAGGTVVLKGAGSLITDGDVMHLCSAGNPGMASGGMGDVLSGIIGGLLAQKLSPVDAARVGVYAHSAAADLCVQTSGERGLKATDLFPYVRLILNGKM
ncbi:NAD(P)H-hydrate dehydratase [Neptunomonas sp.]|uniref:NAD(P)H-hydrate dehydratase n=1 Tax=Neptunomonas sp. TaxID=1971898 RepID=UPI0025CBA9FA|nr:NAD(P)H-hydrate dehydratase [Neptunomonas sp.]